MSAGRRFVVLLNEGSGPDGSGGGADPSSTLRARFATHGVDADVRVLAPGADVTAAAREALASRPDVVVAAGGDGTVGTVAGVLAGTGTPLGVLPLGTLNHFARDLGVPLELDAAVDAACRGRVERIDVGRVNDHVFLNNSSLGLYPKVVQKRDELRGRLGHGKWRAFAWAALEVFRRCPFMDVRITVDGTVLPRRTPLLFVGNNAYELTDLHLGERTRLDAGILCVHVVNRTTRAGLLLLALEALLGRLRQARGFETFSATRLEVDSRRHAASVATDGEVSRLALPLSYEIVRGALAVVAPPRE